ncbi:DUF881 domain-containing protein [Calidifontibacter terrae]
MTSGPTRDPAASMSLITNIIAHPLDPSYADEAARRQANGQKPSSGTRSPLLIGVMFLIGLGLAASAMTLRAPVSESQKQQKSLVSRVTAGQKAIDTRSATIRGLNQEISGLQTAALNRSNLSDVSRQLSAAEVVTGAIAVHGPGLILTVDDAASAGVDAQGNPRTDQSDTGRLTSGDLQVIVNGLWQAGAEAVSINGQRVTSLTAIRFAGQAILVNFRPLSPPYAISAIGPPGLGGAFDKNSGGAYLGGLVKGFDIRSSRSTGSNIHIPAAPSVKLYHAKVLEEQP